MVWGYGEPGAAVTVALSGDGGLVLMKKMARVKGQCWTLTGQLGMVSLEPRSTLKPTLELLVGLHHLWVSLPQGCEGSEASQVLVVSFPAQ